MRVDRDLQDANLAVEKEWVEFTSSPERRERMWTYLQGIASTHRNGMSCKLFQKCPGGFKYCFALRFEDGLQWIFRFPLPKSSMLPQRKTEAEVAVVQFIREKTSTPVPKVIASGVTEGEFEKLGPYVLMEFVEGELLSELLLDFDDENQRMRKDIEESTLRHIYRQVAGFYLELFAHEFSAIGSLEMECLESGNAWRAASEPLTFKLNETQRMMVAAEMPVSSSPFTSTSEYFEHLAFQTRTSLAKNKTTHLHPQEAFQNFNTVYLLRSMAQRFAAKIEGMPHKLYCDDLRFGNIIVNDSYDILAIIDFEFTYAAPASFLGSPPWWLAGTEPFERNDDDKKDYEAKMYMFIDGLEQEETARNDQAHVLSRFMRQCWANGFFWYNVAVRESVKLPQVMTHCLRIEPFRSFLQKPAWDAEDDFDTIMLALECMKIKPGE